MEQQEDNGSKVIAKLFIGFAIAALAFLFLTGILVVALLHGGWKGLGAIDIVLVLSICIFLFQEWFASNYERKKQ
jgi:hypothetical protein